MPQDRKRTRVQQYWQWRYRDFKPGQIHETTVQLTEEEATRLPEAERIEGSMSLIEMDFDEFPETGPEIHSLVPEEWRDHDQSSEHSLPVKTGRRQPTSGRKNLRSRDRPLISGNLS